MSTGAGCRFPGCSLTNEPGYAVHAAIERGDIAPTRFERYVEMLAETIPLCEFSDAYDVTAGTCRRGAVPPACSCSRRCGRERR